MMLTKWNANSTPQSKRSSSIRQATQETSSLRISSLENPNNKQPETTYLVLKTSDSLETSWIKTPAPSPRHRLEMGLKL